MDKIQIETKYGGDQVLDGSTVNCLWRACTNAGNRLGPAFVHVESITISMNDAGVFVVKVSIRQYKAKDGFVSEGTFTVHGASERLCTTVEQKIVRLFRDVLGSAVATLKGHIEEIGQIQLDLIEREKASGNYDRCNRCGQKLIKHRLQPNYMVCTCFPKCECGETRVRNGSSFVCLSCRTEQPA